jgi:hypothetical protein
LEQLRRRRLLDQAVRNFATERGFEPRLFWKIAGCNGVNGYTIDAIRAEFARLERGGA